MSSGSPQWDTSPGGGGGGRKGQSGNHLLNFQLEKREVGPADTRPVHHRPNYRPPRKMKKLGFLHSNSDVRFGVTPGDYGPQIVDPDRPLPWDNVQMVFLNSRDSSRCPVCLEPPVCPKITQCGHVFCWTCALQYLSYTSEPARKCPICVELISGDELKTVRVQRVKSVKVSDTVEVSLRQRACSTVFSQQFDATSATRGLVAKRLPSASDPASTFAKFSVVDSMVPVFAQERQQLEAGQRIAIAESEHSMPFYEGALTQLAYTEQRYSAYIEQRYSVHAISRPTVAAAAPTVVGASSDGPKVEPSSEEDGPPAQSMWSSGSDEDEQRAPEPALPAWGMQKEAPTPVPSKTQDKPVLEPAKMIDDTGKPPPAAVAGLTQTTLAAEASGDISYFYQSSDGQPVFLHPLEMRCLQEDSHGVGGMGATTTLTVVESESHLQDEVTKKRFKFLSHLPEGSAFSIVEINAKKVVSPQTWSRFSEMFKQRDDKRRKQRKEQNRKDSHYSKKAAAAQSAANEQLPAYLSQHYARRDESVFDEEFFKVLEMSAAEAEAEVAAVVRDSCDDVGRPVKSFANVTKKMGYFPELSQQFPTLGGDTSFPSLGGGGGGAPPPAAAAAAASGPATADPPPQQPAMGQWGAGGGSAKRADGVYSIADAASKADDEQKVASSLKEAWAEGPSWKEPEAPVPTPQGKGKKKKKGKQLLFATGQYR